MQGSVTQNQTWEQKVGYTSTPAQGSSDLKDAPNNQVTSHGAIPRFIRSYQTPSSTNTRNQGHKCAVLIEFQGRKKE